MEKICLFHTNLEPFLWCLDDLCRWNYIRDILSVLFTEKIYHIGNYWWWRSALSWKNWEGFLPFRECFKNYKLPRYDKTDLNYYFTNIYRFKTYFRERDCQFHILRLLYGVFFWFLWSKCINSPINVRVRGSIRPD